MGLSYKLAFSETSNDARVTRNGQPIYYPKDVPTRQDIAELKYADTLFVLRDINPTDLVNGQFPFDILLRMSNGTLVCDVPEVFYLGEGSGKKPTVHYNEWHPLGEWRQSDAMGSESPNVVADKSHLPGKFYLPLRLEEIAKLEIKLMNRQQLLLEAKTN